MLESVKIARRQSEIRQELATLAAKTDPTDDEIRSMETLDAEYHQNETRYRAALIAEDEERREAGAELETRSDRERADLVGRFELRQVALHLDEGRAFSGATAEVVAEMREAGGYRGVPVPLEALETRAGETVASGTPDPLATRPIVDRIFAPTVAGRMGVNVVNIPQGSVEWPIATAGATAGWADGETAAVAGPSAFATTDKALSPNQTFGVQVKITRKALKQSGAGLEQAVRRDMQNAITIGLDRAVFQGTGANGQPLGVITGAATYGIAETAIDADVSYAAFRDVMTGFLTANAITAPSGVRVMIRPEIWADLDDDLITGTAETTWDRFARRFGAGNITLTSNALDAPSGSPAASKALLTTTTNGLAPVFLGLWGGVDVIRDPYADAASGGLRITGLLTADVQVPRAVQLRVLTGLQ